MEKNINDLEQLTDLKLSTISGGGKNGANLFLSGVAGAAEGIMYCAQTGAFLPPQIYAACAAGGAAVGIIFPH